MRKQLIAISVLTAVLVIAWSNKIIDARNLGKDWAFLYWMTMATCAVTVIVLSINCLVEGRKKPGADPGHAAARRSANRRNSFRVIYPEDLRPTLLVEQVDNRPKRPLEFSVLDLSEEGLCFLDDGSLGKAREISGRIIFKNGETTPVSFDIVRRYHRRISVRLQYDLPWAKLIKEQQKILSLRKSS